jgi:hypothetical protein
MKILELQGFSGFRFPASDLDFRSFPGNFGRNLPENLLRRSLPDSTEVMFLMMSSLGRASGDFFPSTRTFARKLPETIVHFASVYHWFPRSWPRIFRQAVLDFELNQLKSGSS